MPTWPFGADIQRFCRRKRTEFVIVGLLPTIAADLWRFHSFAACWSASHALA